MNEHLTRRHFLQHAAAGSAALAWLGTGSSPLTWASESTKPALLGGAPVHQGPWPVWPNWREAWEPRILEVLRSGHWYRGNGEHVAEFEMAYAQLLGAKRCLATASGTTALMVALHVLDVDAGDEVIVSPFTFIATYNAVLAQKALPVFADTDPTTLMIDPASIESRLTERTRAILPVHIYGIPCDMDRIMPIARQHQLPVIEDACQAWLAEYKGRKCGVLADLGCFSFQNSKHLPAGEGGAVTGNSDELLDRCQSYHNCGKAFGSFKGDKPFFTRGANFRMQQIQAVMLMQQFEKLIAETAQRRENAAYMSAQLGQIPGIKPVRLPENTQPVWHLYPFRYDAQQFSGLSRDQFVRALNAEGVPCGAGYQEQYFDGLLDEAIQSRGYKRLFSAQRLKEYRDGLHELKGNREACATTVAMTQNLLLSERNQIDKIIEAVAKIHTHSTALAKV
jgi:dTDP-4-amino-4,6-dideoxygalactose transaminase